MLTPRLLEAIAALLHACAAAGKVLPRAARLVLLRRCLASVLLLLLQGCRDDRSEDASTVESVVLADIARDNATWHLAAAVRIGRMAGW